MHLSLKICHLMPTVLPVITFLRINWPNLVHDKSEPRWGTPIIGSALYPTVRAHSHSTPLDPYLDLMGLTSNKKGGEKQKERKKQKKERDEKREERKKREESGKEEKRKERDGGDYHPQWWYDNLTALTFVHLVESCQIPRYLQAFHTNGLSFSRVCGETFNKIGIPDQWLWVTMLTA